MIALASGCFYTAPINQRPSAAIEGGSSAPLYPNSPVSLQALTSDPDGDYVELTWRAYACTAADDCDTDPWTTSSSIDMNFDVRPLRADGATPVQTVLVTLDASDQYGAHARPMPQVVLGIGDHGPSVTGSASSRYEYVVGTPIDVYATVGDIDYGPSAVNLTWTVVSPPSQPAYTFADLSSTPAPNIYGKTLTAMGSGAWDVRVTATDPLGIAASADVPITMIDDPPPCLEQWTPIAPPPGEQLPVSQPTLFQVLVVNDDLDPYPPVPGDPVLGTTTFAWSLLPPGGSAFQSLTATSNSLALDPADYAPGDVLELRVQVYDRNMTPIACPAADATCSVISNPSCIQRLTWNVEVE